MSYLDAVVKLSSPLTLILFVIGLVVLQRNGIPIYELLMTIVKGKPEIKDKPENQSERDTRIDRQDAEFIGYVKAKLENIEKDIREIKEDGKATRQRLTQHLDDEERNRREDMAEIHNDLEIMGARIDSLKTNSST